MKRYQIWDLISRFSIIIGVILLVIAVYKTSSFIVSSSTATSFKINKTTSSYLSFNYADSVNSVYEIDKLNKLSDFQGKRLLNDYYDFDVSILEESLVDENVEYEIIINDMGLKIDQRYIKIYLSDQSNNSLNGFENTVPVLAVFNDIEDGKVIYTGIFNKDNLNSKFRIRIWVSDLYSKKVKCKGAFSIKVKLK